MSQWSRSQTNAAIHAVLADQSRLLRPVGMLVSLVGIAVLVTAAQSVGRGIPNFGVLVGAGGSALLLAGSLMACRARPDLVGALLGSMTAASFAIALAAVSSAPPLENAEPLFASFHPTLLFGVAFFLFLALRGGFRSDGTAT